MLLMLPRLLEFARFGQYNNWVYVTHERQCNPETLLLRLRLFFVTYFLFLGFYLIGLNAGGEKPVWLSSGVGFREPACYKYNTLIRFVLI